MAPAHDFDDKEEWVDNVEKLLIGRSFWDMWPLHMGEAFMQELRVVQDKEYLPPARERSLLLISPTLEHMRKSFLRVEYMVDQMARHPPCGANPRDWSANVHAWFKMGALDHIDAHQFDEHNEVVRERVVEEFGLLAHYLADGRLRRLPPLHDDEEDEHDDMFSSLKGMLYRHQRRVQQAHSLSRGGRAGAQLTARQRAVYERRW
ncbi:hypothetical protein JCM8208_007415 [Rhodotorula glutinis]